MDPPWRLFRSWRLNLAGFRSYNYGGDVTWTGLFLTGLYELRNFSTGRWFVAYNPSTLSDRRTRGGPLMVNQPGGEWDFQLESDPNKRWIYGAGLHGNHYRRDQTTVSASVRLNWIFTPRLSLEVYAQPLLSSGRYTGFKELARPRSYDFTAYPDPVPTDDPDRIVVDPDGAGGSGVGEEIDDPNFSLASLRGNAVLRWEYSAGSTLFLVWTQNRSDTETIGTFRTGRALDRLVGAAGENIFLLKLSYWWNP